MAGVTRRRAGRPSKALLDRERIGLAAIAVVDETGDFTLPELARRLGVQTASLYHHVEGRAGVIELMRELVSAEMDFVPVDEAEWPHAMLGFFRSYRAAFAAHPRLVPFLATTTVRSPKVIEAYEWMVAGLVEHGVLQEDAMELLTTVENFVIGSALDLAAPDVMWEIPDGVEAPRLAAALAAQADPGRRAEAAFERGLRMLLAGIAGEVPVAG